jgi:hypothetical protein
MVSYTGYAYIVAYFHFMHPVHVYDMMLRKGYSFTFVFKGNVMYSFQDEQVKSDKGHSVPQRMVGAAEMHGGR